MKVIFLSYANSREDFLPSLKEEEDKVYSVLVNMGLRGNYYIHKDTYSTIESVNEYLGKFSNDIVLFCYSGHAGSNSLLLDDTQANAKGIAFQLGECAKKGSLKLVVLNGCSTAGQVKKLLEAGVPAVVATNASIGDNSAKEFAIRFFQNISEKRMTTTEAFQNALGPGQTATMKDISGGTSRDIDFVKALNSDQPLWELFYNEKDAVDLNPLPYNLAETNLNYVPNEQLNTTLFKTMLDSGSSKIKTIQEREDQGEFVELSEKQSMILNNFPFPIAVHLQKLLCPDDRENQGYDKINFDRLRQTAEVFHTTTEFVGFIMIAQLWELKMSDTSLELPAYLEQEMGNYFYMPASQRASFDYIPFIRMLRKYFDTLNDGKGVKYFMEELAMLKELAGPGQPFEIACNSLTNLRRQTLDQSIPENEIPIRCAEAEEMLCRFFEPLGFLHRYNLTSIQNIDILKFRHQLKAQFVHKIVKLMKAFGSQEYNYYFLPTFLDNMGVVLLKQEVNIKNAQRRQFSAERLEFLNLSPFIIDKNAFEKNADLSSLMFFKQYRKSADSYEFRKASRPESEKDAIEIKMEEKYESIRQQFEAFRAQILNEQPILVLNG